jgi:hypothetical protein
MLARHLVLATAAIVLPMTAHADGTDFGGHGWRGGFKPSGTWINTVFVWPRGTSDAACGSPPPTAARFVSLITYFDNGELIEGAGPAAGPPTVAVAVSRSAGHGFWERLYRRSFIQTFRQHYFNAAGLLVRVNVVENTAELKRGDDPATPDVVESYYLFGRGTNVITNVLPTGEPVPEGGPLATRVYGCNQATSRPLTLEE